MKKIFLLLFLIAGGFLHASSDSTLTSPRLSVFFDFGVSANAGTMLAPVPNQFYFTGYGFQEKFHGIKEKPGAGYSLGTIFYPLRTKRLALGFGIAYSIFNYRGEIRSVEIENRLIDTTTYALEKNRLYAYNEMLIQFPVNFRINFLRNDVRQLHFDLGGRVTCLDRINFPEYSHTGMVEEHYASQFSMFYSAGIFYEHIEKDFIFPASLSAGITAQILSNETEHKRKPFFIGIQIAFNFSSFKMD